MRLDPWLYRTVLLLRYGTLDNQDTRIRTSVQVGRLVGLNDQQVHRICARCAPGRPGLIDRRLVANRTAVHCK